MRTSARPSTGLSLGALLGRGVVMVALGCGVALLVNAVRPTSLPLTLRSVPCPGVPAAWGKKIQWIDTAQAQALWQEPGVLFLDARPHADYNFNHLSGALEMPYQEFTKARERASGKLKPGTRVVVYDSGKPCGEAVRVAKQLPELQVSLLTGGCDAWEKAGYSITGGRSAGRGKLGWERTP